MGKKKYLRVVLCTILLLCLGMVLPVMAMGNEGKPDYTGDKAYYDESAQSSVTVTVTLSFDGVPIVGNDANHTTLANLEITVPYFDLAQYGLTSVYRYPTGDTPDYLTDQPVVQRPTVLHLMLYILERYAEGLPADQCGQGKLNMKGEGGGFTNVFGTRVALGNSMFSCNEIPTSCYIDSFWGNDENLMYYVNHKYPLMYPGWGATCDYILLTDGDMVDLGMFTDWDFYKRGAFAYLPQTSYSMETGETKSINLSFTSTTDDKLEYTYSSSTGDGFNWYVMDETGNIETSGSSKSSTVTIGPVSEPGNYMLYVLEKASATSKAAFTPAVAKLTVTESEAIQRAESAIKAIGKVEYTTECQKKITAARTAYDALDAQQKKLFDANLFMTLRQAESTYKQLKEAADKEQLEKEEQEKKNKEAADKVIALINEIGEVSYTEDSRAKIETARKAYDALTKEQKNYVSAEVMRTLTIAETVYETISQTQQAVQATEKLIQSIGQVTYNTSCEAAIKTAREAYNALSEEQKEQISAENLKILTNAETTYAALQKKAEEAAAAAKKQKLEQTKATTGSVTFTWKEDKKAEDGYRIYIKGGKFKKFTKVADTKKGVLSYTVKKAGSKKLAAGTQYEIKIASLKKNGKKTTEVGNQNLKVVTVTSAPSIKSAKRNKAKTAVALKWKKVSGASGYEIQMSTKAKEDFAKVTTAKAKATSYTKKGLNKSQVYYFRMRAYKTINGKTFYSSWSKTMKVKK